MLVPRVPAGFTTRLRRLADNATLAVVFDRQQSKEEGRAVWFVLAVNDAGLPEWVCSWKGSLDGNLEAIAHEVLRWDYRHNHVGSYRQDRINIKAQMAAKKASRDRHIMTELTGIASYMRRAYQAVAYGEPSVGAV